MGVGLKNCDVLEGRLYCDRWDMVLTAQEEKGEGGDGATAYDKIMHGPLQTDMPHALSFVLGTSSSFVFGSLEGSQVSTSAEIICNGRPQEYCPNGHNVVLEGYTTCKPPAMYNTGSHRAVAILWYRAERYIIAVEEGKFNKPQNLFIQGLTEGAKELLLKNPDIPQFITAAAYYELTGHRLFSTEKSFRTFIYDDPSRPNSKDLMSEGCTPSPEMGFY